MAEERAEVQAEVEVAVVEVAAEVDPRTKCHNLMHTLYELHLNCVVLEAFQFQRIKTIGKYKRYR